jgi:hypothetical protein
VNSINQVASGATQVGSVKSGDVRAGRQSDLSGSYLSEILVETSCVEISD